MQVDVESGTLWVREGGDTVCLIGTEDWSDTGRDRDVVPGEETLTGRTTALRFPPGRAVVADGDTGRSGVGNRTLSGLDGPLRVESAVTAVVAFEGRATLRERSTGIDLSFPEKRDVTLGLCRVDPGEGQTITVPGTPEGVATALTYASACHDTTTPVRSHPATRRNPPRIERGDTVDVPETVRAERTDTGIELLVPPERGSLFVLAPLAYYLGARVSVVSRETPLLRAPDAGVSHELPALPGLQADAASLLFGVVTVDCLLRDANGDLGGDSARRLATAGIAPGTTGDADIDERLGACLEAGVSRGELDLPEWHLSVYLSPRPEHVTALSYVLDRLAFVYLPDAEPLPEAERLQRALTEFYRTREEAPRVDPILPDLNRGRLHGWLADGVPVGAFRLFPEAYRNHRTRPPVGNGPTDVTLVVNDERMSAELDAIRTLCVDRENGSGVDLCVERRLDRDALAATLREPTDLFYYIGHCDRAGLRCPDGHLDVGDIEEVGAAVFFLNACGSYQQGVSLVDAGSVAGAVTLRPVLDAQARRVGTAFLRLLVRGFATERALQVASRRAIMNTDYAVVGDGTYGLAGPDDVDHMLARVTRAGDRFQLRVEYGSARTTATYCRSPSGGGTRLSGDERRVSMSRDELQAFLKGLDAPVLYDERYYWATELYRALQEGELGP